MAFTSLDLVRAHLTGINVGEMTMRDVPIILAGTSPAQLPHGGIVNGSAVVKARRSAAPMREIKTLGASWVALSYSRLIRDTVVVANDSSLGVVYTENIDHVVDYDSGRIMRIATGAIANGQTVTVWHDHYHVYAEGDDYSLDTTHGQLSRRSSSLVADGQQVLVDYTVSLGAISDDVIEQAISESGEAVLSLVSDTHHDEPTPAIVIGATHWAVAQVARMRAASVLANSAGAAAISRAAAETWLEIAGQYETTGRAFLSRYANPVSSLAPLRRG